MTNDKLEGMFDGHKLMTSAGAIKAKSLADSHISWNNQLITIITKTLSIWCFKSFQNLHSDNLFTKCLLFY